MTALYSSVIFSWWRVNCTAENLKIRDAARVGTVYHLTLSVRRPFKLSTLSARTEYEGGPQKNEIFSWAIDLFKELQKIH